MMVLSVVFMVMGSSRDICSCLLLIISHVLVLIVFVYAHYISCILFL